jgi:hypothetical protein
MYLGEIKTPYNKQNLIERLGAFLHKEQVQQNILLLLSPTDCQLLSAIFYLENPTHSLIARFFADTLFGKDQGGAFCEFYNNDPLTIINACGMYFQKRLGKKITKAQKK